MTPTALLRLAILASLASCGSGANRCDDPKPVLDPDGDPSGLIACDDGAINRGSDAPSPTAIEGLTCPPDVPNGDCEVDADCVDGSHGRCLGFDAYYPTPGDERCGCTYSCAHDDECAANEACLHPTDLALAAQVGHGLCVPAGCRSDADCPSGECGLSVWQNGGCGTVVQFQCRDAAVDTCRAPADCATGRTEAYCAWGEKGDHFECRPDGGCIPGRPLTVDGGARVASATDRRDWVAAIALPDVDPALRDRLAEAWSAIAAMEHASVASFARFSLELLALGAPPDLLADTQRAALDEVEHARLAYALASRFAGTTLGPGPLSLDGVVPATDPETVLDRLIDEACVGETVGTALVREAARHVTDPALRAVLDRTADDETRHAALAWRALRWLVAAHPELAPSVPGRFAAAAARLLAGLQADGDAPAPAWGLLGAEVSVVVAQDAVLAVVEPCLEAAVGRSVGAASSHARC